MSYKVIFAMTATLNYEIKQMNVKTAFLYEDIKKNIYIKQLTGYITNDTLIYKLKKTLYDLKQSSRV